MANELKVSERDTTLTPRQLRAAGFLPATVYGKNVEPKSVQVDTHDFVQDYAYGGPEFQMSGFVSGPAHVQNVQLDPVSQRPLSVQLLAK